MGGVVFDCLGGNTLPPLERNTAWNKGRKCFHCLGAPNNLIRPWVNVCQILTILCKFYFSYSFAARPARIQQLPRILRYKPSQVPPCCQELWIQQPIRNYPCGYWNRFYCWSQSVFNLLKPNDIYICRTASLTCRRYILNIYSTNIHTEYFKHAA